jgi:Ca-activated chloride channel homolog
MPRRAPALIGAACIFAIVAAGADQAPVSIQPRHARTAVLNDIRVDSNLVLIPVSVTDPRNHAVTGLRRESFRVFEGKTEQTLLHFASEDAPVSVGIVFDSSGSMRDKLAQSREAVARFLDSANPQDEFFLVDFNSTVEIAAPFTGDPAAIESRLLFTGSNGRTALLDAVCQAMEYMKKARNPRKALLVISDGGDNDSRYTESEIHRRVRETDLWIYAIGIYHRGGIMLPEGERGETLLESLADESGGRHFAVGNPADLPEIAGNIGRELRHQYVIGYRPATSGRAGKYHRVQVKLVEGRDLKVTWRPGYFERE